MNDESADSKPGLRRRRFLDRTPAPATVVGAGTQILGNLRGSGTFLIAGEVRGDGHLDGHLQLLDGGTWHGEVHAREARVAGTVDGSLRVQEKLEILRTARISGSVSARTIAIANGAVIEGDIEVTSGGQLVRFEERRFD
ncbi:MAG: polymer-forming cytoskeletal protein [Gammaproteobacteria bacterium]|nr:polymer-forming cytoskeletal protein [Gammaproteobacteria bacterium]